MELRTSVRRAFRRDLIGAAVDIDDAHDGLSRGQLEVLRLDLLNFGRASEGIVRNSPQVAAIDQLLE